VLVAAGSACVAEADLRTSVLDVHVSDAGALHIAVPPLDLPSLAGSPSAAEPSKGGWVGAPPVAPIEPSPRPPGLYGGLPGLGRTGS
jgi:hypothetical protein